MAQGIVKWFNPVKGYGFIESEGQSIFVHRKDLPPHETLHRGDKVTFELAAGEKGPLAMNLVCTERHSAIKESEENKVISS